MEPLVNNRPQLKSPKDLFVYHGVSQVDLKKYQRMLAAGNTKGAMNAFLKKYVRKNMAEFQTIAQGYLVQAELGEMQPKHVNQMGRNLAIYSTRIQNTVNNNYEIFLKKAVGPSTFEKRALTNAKIKRIALNDTLNEFKRLTNGAMSNTTQNVLTQTRKMQRQMVVRNNVIKSPNFTGNAQMEIGRFKDTLRKTNPDYYQAMEDGNIFKSRSFGKGQEKVINYKLDEYTDMSARTTLMNVDRTTSEVISKVNGDNVVEFYELDSRDVETERDICQDILSVDTEGRSLLALDDSTADALGILTLDQAREQFSMSPNCRHSIKPVSETFQNRINKLIGVAV